MTHEQAAYRHHPLDAEAPTAADQQADLRDRIAEALREHYLCTNRDEADADGNLPCRCGDWREPGAEADDENDWDSHLADAALAVLPPTADQAAEAPAAECSAQNRNYESGPRLCIRAAQHTGDHIDERGFHWSDTVAVYPLADGTFRAGVNRAVLRRLAAEAQQQETRQSCACGQDGCEYCDVDEAEEDVEERPDTETPVYDHRAWETYHRDAGCGCTDPNPVDCAVPHGTGAWLCVCHRLSGPPIKESDPPGTFLTAEQEAVRKHYRHPNRCLSVRGAFRCELGVDHGGDHRLKRTVWRDAPAAVEQPAAADTSEETDAIRLDEDGRDVETGHLPGCASQSYPDPGICYCEETGRG